MYHKDTSSFQCYASRATQAHGLEKAIRTQRMTTLIRTQVKFDVVLTIISLMLMCQKNVNLKICIRKSLSY